MDWLNIIFWFFSFLLIGSAFKVISSRNPVHSALYLVLAFFASTGLWLLAEAEFLALILIIVYVGAVMTLFLFVVMTVNLKAQDNKVFAYWPFLILLGVILLSLMGYAIYKSPLFINIKNPVAVFPSNIHMLGELLYTQYFYIVELAACLLLVAIVAAISLSFKGIRKRKVQDPQAQIAVKKSERLRIIKGVEK